jgi:hypothetical protein
LLAGGVASRYDPGVFEHRAIPNHQRYGHLPSRLPVDRYNALADCSRVGDVVLVCYEGRCWNALVADCAGIADGGLAWMQTNGIAGEVDYETAVDYGCVGKHIQVFEIRYLTAEWR